MPNLRPTTVHLNYFTRTNPSSVIIHSDATLAPRYSKRLDENCNHRISPTEIKTARLRRATPRDYYFISVHKSKDSSWTRAIILIRQIPSVTEVMNSSSADLEEPFTRPSRTRLEQ